MRGTAGAVEAVAHDGWVDDRRRADKTKVF